MDNYSTPKKMKRVGDLFEKYKKQIKPPQASVEKACSVVIKEVTGYTIDIKNITYTVSVRTVYLHIPSLLKSEIKAQHAKIIKKLEEQLGKNTTPKTIL